MKYEILNFYVFCYHFHTGLLLYSGIKFTDRMHLCLHQTEFRIYCSNIIIMAAKSCMATIYSMEMFEVCTSWTVRFGLV